MGQPVRAASMLRRADRMARRAAASDARAAEVYRNRPGLWLRCSVRKRRPVKAAADGLP